MIETNPIIRIMLSHFVFPKPIIEIKNKPMIQWVIDSLKINANYIFIIQKEHQEKFNIKSVLKILKPDCQIIELDHVTEGAACTTLLAKKYIAFATSSGWPTLFNTVLSDIILKTSSLVFVDLLICFSISFVKIGPGLTLLTLILYFPKSNARHLVSCLTAPLEVLYGKKFG